MLIYKWIKLSLEIKMTLGFTRIPRELRIRRNVHFHACAQTDPTIKSSLCEFARVST